jgi:hypothetical protein
MLQIRNYNFGAAFMSEKLALSHIEGRAEAEGASERIAKEKVWV